MRYPGKVNTIFLLLTSTFHSCRFSLVHLPCPFAKRAASWQYPSERNGNIVVALLSAAETAETAEDAAGGRLQDCADVPGGEYSGR